MIHCIFLAFFIKIQINRFYNPIGRTFPEKPRSTDVEAKRSKNGPKRKNKTCLRLAFLETNRQVCQKRLKSTDHNIKCTAMIYDIPCTAVCMPMGSLWYHLCASWKPGNINNEPVLASMTHLANLSRLYRHTDPPSVSTTLR